MLFNEPDRRLQDIAHIFAGFILCRPRAAMVDLSHAFGLRLTPSSISRVPNRCPRRAIPRTHGAVRRDSRVLRGAPRACRPRRDAKRSPREARNLLGTALNPCQNFGMYVRTAMLSHF